MPADEGIACIHVAKKLATVSACAAESEWQMPECALPHSTPPLTNVLAENTECDMRITGPALTFLGGGYGGDSANCGLFPIRVVDAILQALRCGVGRMCVCGVCMGACTRCVRLQALPCGGLWTWASLGGTASSRGQPSKLQQTLDVRYATHRGVSMLGTPSALRSGPKEGTGLFRGPVPVALAS